MGVTKTEMDVRRGKIARAITARLHEAGVYGIDVGSAPVGGRYGPYHVTLRGLNRAELEALLPVIARQLGVSVDFKGIEV